MWITGVDLSYYADQNETTCRPGLLVPPEPSPISACCTVNISGPPGPPVDTLLCFSHVYTPSTFAFL